MTRHLLVLSLFICASVMAQEGVAVHGDAAPTPRVTMTPTEYLKQKENEYTKQEAELLKHQGALEFWQKELKGAKKNQTTAGIIGHSNLILIPATYYFGGKFLKWIAPAAPPKSFLSLNYARQYLSTHPKLVGSIVISAEAGAAFTGTYYYWVLSDKEIEELTNKVNAAKIETEKARIRVSKALADLNGRKPDKLPDTGDKPDMLDGNE